VPRSKDVELREALTGLLQRSADYHGQRTEYAEVVRVNPVLVVELNTGSERLEEDEALVIPRELWGSVAAAEKGDTAVVTLMDDSRYLLRHIVRDADAEDEPGGGGGGGGAPSGPAGGVLSGTYPNPGFAADMATQAELDGVSAARAATQAEVDAHEALTTGAHGGIVSSADSRLTDSRAPSGPAGGDLSGTYPNPQIAAGAIVDGDVAAGAAIGESKLALASDAAAGTPSRRSLGTGATQAAAGNHDHTQLGAGLRIGPVDASAGGAGLRLSGAATGNEGGQLDLELGADHDTAFNAWSLDAYQDDLRIHDGVNVPVTIRGDTKLVEFTNAPYTGGVPILPQRRVSLGSMGASQTIDCQSRTDVIVRGTLNAANCALTFTNVVAGATILLELTQDGAGGRTISVVAPTLTTLVGPFQPNAAINAISLLTLYSPDGTGLLGIASVVGDEPEPVFEPFYERCVTIDPRTATNQANLVGANRTAYMRAMGSKAGATAIRFIVAVTGGNISVAVFANTGSGLTAAPGARKGVSATVATPAVGTQTLALGAATDVEAGDWLAISADSITPEFRRSANGPADGYIGLSTQQSVHPAPANAASLFAASQAFYLEAI
jgi:hypothetical protein